MDDAALTHVHSHQVWMRLSHMSNFRKLWGVWQGVSLKAGDTVTVTVVNQYNTFSFDGTKVIRRGLGRPPSPPFGP